MQYCGFRIANDYYAVPVLEVQEVMKPLKKTHVPLSEPHITGLMNLRGQIVTTISLRNLFALQEEYPHNYMNVIVRSGDSLNALMVDEILDVIEVEDSTFEQVPDTLNDTLRQFVDGVHKLNDKLLIILDLKRIIKSTTKDMDH